MIATMAELFSSAQGHGFDFLFSSVSASVQNGRVALGKAHKHFSFCSRPISTSVSAHKRSARSHNTPKKVALQTAPMCVWLKTERSQPREVQCRQPSFSTALCFSRRCDVKACPCSETSSSLHVTVVITIVGLFSFKCHRSSKSLLLRRRRPLAGDACCPHEGGCPPQLPQVATE